MNDEKSLYTDVVTIDGRTIHMVIDGTVLRFYDDLPMAIRAWLEGDDPTVTVS